MAHAEECPKNLVRRVFPGTRIRMRNQYWGGPGERKYELWWAGDASDADMRELANEIEAALPAKAAGTIACGRIPEARIALLRLLPETGVARIKKRVTACPLR